MTPQEEFAQLLERRAARIRYNYAATLFPDEGPLSRQFYPKHMEFFAWGKSKRFRGFVAANRVGKSVAASYELACHLTGIYPAWWEGKRFTRPIEAWAASDTNTTTRDGLQKKLIGTQADPGTGVIPRHLLGKATWVPNGNGACDTILIRHINGWSELGFKSYEQGRAKFQAVERHVILLDEEPRDIGIYSECITRTMTYQGHVLLSFTALRGVTPLVLRFLPELAGATVTEVDDHVDQRVAVVCGWDNAPHLTEQDKRELSAEYLPHERSARTTGMPSIAEGSVYPVPEEEVLCSAFPIPEHWPRVCAMDPGGSPGGNGKTAGLWCAIDRQSDTLYFYSEHYRGWAEPAIHAAAFKARGSWIPCVSDDAHSIETGRSMIAVYKSLGLKIRAAQKSDREARILALFNRFSSGTAKIFKGSCPNLLMEFRIHRVDEKGKYVGPCHLLNCAEYIVQSGIQKAEMMTSRNNAPKQHEETFGMHG